MDDPWLTVKCWADAAWAYMKTYASVFMWFLVLPTGGLFLVLVVMGLFGAINEDSAVELNRKMLPWIIASSGFLAGLIVSIQDRHTLGEIVRPRIKMEYHGTDFRIEDSRAIGVFAYIKLTGLCHEPVHFEVYCSDVTATNRGSQNLHRHVGVGTHRVLSRTEPELLPVLLYDWNKVPGPFIECLVASKLHQDEIERGDEFLVTISAYGKMEPAHIQLRCWIRDQKFNVEEVKPTNN